MLEVSNDLEFKKFDRHNNNYTLIVLKVHIIFPRGASTLYPPPPIVTHGVRRGRKIGLLGVVILILRRPRDLQRLRLILVRRNVPCTATACNRNIMNTNEHTHIFDLCF